MKYELAIIWHGRTKEDVFKCDSLEDAEKTLDGFKQFWEIDHSEIRPQKEHK